MWNRSVWAHYAVLVGLPFLGVLGLLQVGDTLTAQPSIAGTWALDATFDANQNTPCAVSLSGFADSSIEITQSGRFLEITLPNLSRDRLRGTLEFPSLLAEVKPALFGDDVFGLIRVSGRLEREGQQLVLHGLLSMPRRIECFPVPFRAVSVSEPAFPRRIR